MEWSVSTILVSLQQNKLWIRLFIHKCKSHIKSPLHTLDFKIGIRHADHVAPFIRKSWQPLRREAAVARSDSSLADSDHGVCFLFVISVSILSQGIEKGWWLWNYGILSYHEKKKLSKINVSYAVGLKLAKECLQCIMSILWVLIISWCGYVKCS
jgi:hypothetical protein